MEKLTIDLQFANDFYSSEEFSKNIDLAVQAREMLYNKSGKGNDFLGWLDLPASISKEFIADINDTANKLKANSKAIVVIGIGGSYLGAKAVIEALSSSFKDPNTPEVIFAGHHLSEDYHAELLNYLDSKDFSIVVISKSGTTTEPAIAFRLLKKKLEEKYSKDECKSRVVAITDAKKGALKQLSDNEGYKTYVIPDDVGGRFSVFTPVGLLPIALAGFDILSLVDGAQKMQNELALNKTNDNLAIQYAAARNTLYQKGKSIEVLVNYNPKLQYIAEWWKQLYGESEGKETKGIFPASVGFTTDLHSLGQYIQDGERMLFETVLTVEKTKMNILIPETEDNLDKLNYLAGKNLDYVNKKAELGTIMAHNKGNVPNIKLILPEITENYLGQLLYFYENACAISGYVLDVNPFDQPGVEEYKTNMFKLLGKEGY